MIRPIVPKQNKEVILSYVLDRHLHHPTPQNLLDQNLLEDGEVDDGEVDDGEVEEEAVEEEAVVSTGEELLVFVLVLYYNYNFPPHSWKREIFGDFHIIPVADSGKPPIV